jgi:hypothetical protein
MVAVAVPELAFAAVNVVEPQPLVVGVASVARVKVGNTMAMVSAAARPVFKENVKAMDDGADNTGLETTRVLSCRSGATTAGDEIIVVAGTLSSLASVTAILRVFKFATWVAELVVMPVAICTVHCLRLASAAVAKVNDTVAVAVPVLEAAAVNVVEPQPLVKGVDIVVRAKVGSTILMTSPIAKSAVEAKTTVRDDAADVTGLLRLSLDWYNAGTARCGILTAFVPEVACTAPV